MSACEHPVGYVPDELVTARDWNSRLAAFVAKVEDFNERGQHSQIPHLGTVQDFEFCPACGQRLDRVALGLLTYSEAYEIHQARSLVCTQEHHD